ncbi:MAG: hypothetical protein K2N61_04830 [Lachnospiraceae bacterium]|nr:hypothetical protein [Lachnospiraceae bacterium]
MDVKDLEAIRQIVKEETDEIRRELKKETNEIRQELKKETDEIRQELKKETNEIRQELKKETNEIRRELKKETNEIRQELKKETNEIRQELKKETNEIRQETQNIYTRLEAVEEETKRTRLILENETNPNIKAIAEGHLDLSRKLHEAIKIDNEKEMMKIRLNILEGEMKLLKEQMVAI